MNVNQRRSLEFSATTRSLYLPLSPRYFSSAARGTKSDCDRPALSNMTSIYIDEDVGKDDSSAHGTESSPYKTLLYALIQHGSAADAPTYLTRKSETGPVSPDGDPAARLEWKPPAKSAVKKATNAYESHKKKVAKQADLAIREKEEADKRAKVLEEAKKVIIKEDESLPAPVKIRLDEEVELKTDTTPGKRVKVVGRVHRLRSQKGVIFITLRYGVTGSQLHVDDKC